jgi:polysaccharide export outer membrane protein
LNNRALKILVCAGALVWALPTFAGAARQEPAAPKAQATSSAEGQLPTTGDPIRSSYVLGPDDQITIQVSDVPDISGKTQRLDPNGDLRLPMVGRVHAGGMTLEQLEAELATKLKVYIQHPDVAVTVTEFHSQPVSVIGAVNTSGVHQLEGRKTLIEMLSLAGGVSPDAGPTVRIARRLDWGPVPLPNAAADPTGGFSIAEIDLKSLLNGRSPEKNIVIRPHDVISIPRAESVFAFVLGEVGKPGPVQLSGGTAVSVLEALSSAGGVLRSAASSKARILRRAEGGRSRTEVSVDLKQMMQGKANDLSLAAGDILIVPGSNSKKAATRVLEAAVQAGVMIGTYGVVR